jgi:iron-sulfur cluster assembly protein
MAPEYVPLLDQATLDYVELESGQFHFIFLNPKDSGYHPPSAD